MKIQVLHDEQGNIISFSVLANEAQGALTLMPKENHVTKVLDLPGKKGEKLNSEEDFRNLVERVRQYKVDTTAKEGKLVRKDS